MSGLSNRKVGVGELLLLLAIPLGSAVGGGHSSAAKQDVDVEPRSACRVEEAGGMCFHAIAHRGASAYAPENTLAAFRKAIELGVAEVEMDTQLSADGVVVLYHDATLDEKTPLSGAVREHTAAVLEAADIGSWFDASHPEVEQRFAGTSLDRFEAALVEIGDRVHYHVELKSLEPELPGKVVEHLRAAGLLGRATLTSFAFEQAERARALAPDAPICWLLRSELLGARWRSAALAGEQRAQIDRARAAGFQMVAVRANQLSAEAIEYGRSRGIQVRAFGIQKDEDMERAIALGVEGMTTNWPDKLLARLTR